jgi:hypothetical protein
MGKDKAEKQGKQAKGKPDASSTLPSVANHPRAGGQVARMKAWAGLGGFGLVAILSERAGVPAADLLLRAIVGGIAAYVIAWAVGVAVWRHLVIAELRAVRMHRLAKARASAARQSESAG